MDAFPTSVPPGLILRPEAESALLFSTVELTNFDRRRSLVILIGTRFLLAATLRAHFDDDAFAIHAARFENTHDEVVSAAFSRDARYDRKHCFKLERTHFWHLDLECPPAPSCPLSTIRQTQLFTHLTPGKSPQQSDGRRAARVRSP